tara:strand:+ start:2828 stop:3727 length:900 start_codon:yes stop_codon:yes gene_type:complete
MKNTRFMQRGGLLLRAEHWGSPTAPLVMLVHGFPDTPHSWYGVAEQLVDAGYQVLMPWLRGYTEDSAKRDAAYDLISCAEDLAAWCNELGQPQAHLVGHDWGAVLAQIAALHATQADQPLWQSISLLAIPAFYPLLRSTHALPSLPKQLKLSSYMAHLQSAQSWRWVSADHAAWVEKTWQRWSPSWLFTPDDIAEARATLSQPDIAWAATRYYRSLFTPWQASTRQVYALMSKPIRQPLLLLAGRDDGCMHSGFHERLTKDLVGNSQSHLLPGVGHFLQAENPRMVADYVLRFITTQKR